MEAILFLPQGVYINNLILFECEAQNFFFFLVQIYFQWLD